MVELQHGQQPADLIVFNQQNPNATPADFNGSGFHAIKPVIKQALHRDQAGLCVYCEKRLEANEGQIEHIKPKATHSQGHTVKSSTPSLKNGYAIKRTGPVWQ